MATSICRKCGIEYTRKGHCYKDICKRCYKREYYLKNKEKIKEQMKIYRKEHRKELSLKRREWAKRNPEKIKEYQRRRLEKRRTDEAYREKLNSKKRISREEILTLLAGRPKPEACEICGGKGKICFDHDHKTNKFRGWICNRCNLILGWIKEDISKLQKLIDYLKKNK